MAVPAGAGTMCDRFWACAHSGVGESRQGSRRAIFSRCQKDRAEQPEALWGKNAVLHCTAVRYRTVQSSAENTAACPGSCVGFFCALQRSGVTGRVMVSIFLLAALKAQAQKEEMRK